MNDLIALEGAFVWIIHRGIYSALPLYARKETLFAKKGAGYLKLLGNGATSLDKLYWKEFNGGPQFIVSDNGFKPPTFKANRRNRTAIAA